MTDGEATADVAATALGFNSSPTEAETGCRFTITPSATSTVDIVSTVGNRVIGCGSQTDASTWSSISITSQTTTNFPNTMKIQCVHISETGSSDAKVTLQVTITAATTTTATTTVSSSSNTSTTPPTNDAMTKKIAAFGALISSLFYLL